MFPILTIAAREVKRVRTRFGGGASPVAVVMMLGVLAFSAYALREMSVLGNGLYRVGVSADGPQIHDARFATLVMDRAHGQALLDQHVLDVYIDGTRVVSRNDDKSRYAVGALKKYLEKQELARIYATNDITNTFPLRVEITYLAVPSENTTATPGRSLTDLITPPPPSPDTSPNPPAPSASDAALTQQLQQIESTGQLTEIKLDNTSGKQVVIPSLMTPPAPFAQVIVAFLFILPMTFISIFFTSSFMDEKINRRLTILLSAPITPLQIILGKMLPYAVFALVAVAGIAWGTHANILLSLAIFAPTMLFIFAIYLMVPLMYRTFKDTTFISMLATTLTTAYLIFPAMFAGISDLAFMSPLTLAVKMYRNEPFGWQEYLFPSVPMVLIFGLSLYASSRMLNEEFLMGYRPITRKIADAIYLLLDRAHPYLSVALFSIFVIPIVYLTQLVILAIATNLPMGYAIFAILIAAAMVEEIAKSASIAVLIDNRLVKSWRQMLALAFLAALGFLVGEKLLLFVSMNIVAQTALSAALFNTGFVLVPLAAHFVFTTMVVVLNGRFGVRYSIAILAATILHSIYNYLLVGGIQ